MSIHSSKTDPAKTKDIELQVRDERGKNLWKEAEDRKVDLAVLSVDEHDFSDCPISWLDKSDFLVEEITLQPGQPIIAVGYPRGTGDGVYSLPLAFSGALASAYGVRFMGEPVFLIDRNLAEGMSGSPVFTTYTSFEAFDKSSTLNK